MFLLLVACNTPPGAPVVAITPAAPTTLDDLQVVIQGEAADKQGDPVTYTYAWFRDEARTEHAGATVPASATTRDETWKVVVTPSDGTLAGDPVEAAVVILDLAPTAALTLSPASPTAADAVVVTATTEDADDDAVTLTWAWTRDGVGAGITASSLPAGTLVRGEAWEVTGTPDDGTLAGTPATAAFVVGNAPPTLATVSLGPDGATVTDALTASFTGAVDADGDDVSVRVAWWVDGVEVHADEVGADEEATLEGYTDKGAEVVVVATPFDGYDEGPSVSSAPLVIANSAPGLTGAVVSPTPLYVDSVVTCVGVGWDDADGDPEGWRTTWTSGGAVLSEEAILPSGLYARGTALECTLTPDDGESLGAPVTSPTVTVANSAPRCTASGVTIGPDPATIADAIAVTADAYEGCADPDGDAIVQLYSWYVDGALSSTGATLSPGVAPRGAAVALVTGWNDGFETGAEVSSNTVTVVNSPPSVTASLTPSPLTAAGEAGVTVVATDLEGDPVRHTYAWTVDGAAAGTGATLAATSFARGQVVAVTVTPDDGWDLGTPASASTTVANAPPSAPTLEILPARPTPDDDLVCSIAAAGVDADDDALSYTFAWSVGGVPYGGATTTVFPGDTVPASATVNGQTWTCTVEVSDGIDTTTASVSIEVGCDDDGDGYASVECGGEDCDDADATIHPGATEVCDGSGADEDCDGLADDDDPSLAATVYYPDADGDTYGDATGGRAACTRPVGWLTNGDDCDDANARVRPGAQEVCDAADTDEDCDGLADDADAGVTGQSSYYVDADGDGEGDDTATATRSCERAAGFVTSRTDCDDTDPLVNTAAEEVCDDGIDNNCDDAAYPCGVEGSGGTTDAWATLDGDSGFGGYDADVGDLNGDGIDDLIVSGDSRATRAWLGPIAAGTYPSADADVTWSVGATWFNLGEALGFVGDMDGDGAGELLLNGNGPDSVSYVAFLLHGDAALASEDLTYAYGDVVGPSSGSPNLQAMLGVGDVNGDGLADALLGEQPAHGSASPGYNTLYLGDAGRTYTTVAYGATAYYYGDERGAAAPGDMDGDGLDDVLVRMRGSSGTGSVIVIAGDSAPVADTLTAGDAWFSATNAYYLCAPGDVDGDGYMDAGIATTSATLYFVPGPPSGATTTADALASTTGNDCRHGDLDGDGVTEVVKWSGGGSAAVYATPIGSGSLGTAEATLSLSVREGGVGDATGDGVDDLLLTTDYWGYLFPGGTP